MKFHVRHQISDLEEEVYEFEIFPNSIKYVAFYKSKRAEIDEPFGWDWEDIYKDQKEQEIYEFCKNHNIDIDDDIINMELESKLQKIYNKYNPCMYGLLSGTSHYSVKREHPLRITKVEILREAIKHVCNLEVDAW